MDKKGASKTKGSVNFASQDGKRRDKKFEGFSNLKGAVEQQNRRLGNSKEDDLTANLEDEYISNLHKQIVVMERQIVSLKQKEIEVKNQASSYETLLKDKIPLNEHILALKNKFNNEQDALDKNEKLMDQEIHKEKTENKKKNGKIEILKREYDDMQTGFQENKEVTTKQLKNMEFMYYTELHTKEILTEERALLNEKLGKLKQQNQQDQRTITKDKFHNTKDEDAKARKLRLEEIDLEFNKVADEVLILQAKREEEKERNEDPQLELKQKKKTNDLQQEHAQLQTDIKVSENKISDLQMRTDILLSTIEDLLKEKRKVDKLNKELEDFISGENMDDEQKIKRHKDEERKMRIKQEKDVVNLRLKYDLLESTHGDEEGRSKTKLDEKLKKTEDLEQLGEECTLLTNKQAVNREDLIKMNVRNSQLTSQDKMLEIEEKQLLDSNTKLTADNKKLEEENAALKKKIALTIQKIDINNLLKDIDVDELKIVAKNNKNMSSAITKLVTQWDYIVEQTASKLE